jgi:hypothetical protein
MNTCICRVSAVSCQEVLYLTIKTKVLLSLGDFYTIFRYSDARKSLDLKSVITL